MRDRPLHRRAMNKLEFYQAVSKAGKPVIVDFWAVWCAPCKMTKPILESLAKEYEDRITFLPVDADESPELIEEFRIFGIPAVLALKDRKEVSRVTGAQPEANYRSMFEALALGKEIKITMAPFDRLLRLGAGAALVIVGIFTSNLLVAGIGGLLAFLGVYDRCPVWAALTGMMQRK